jgi:glutathione synthase/RimK-type ligase-like ATP-grasp enzyme
MIAIHISKDSFGERWINYCEKQNIDCKVVNCYDNDIIYQLEDCDALMWHHNQMYSKDILFAKQLMFALEQSGKIVFPDFNTAWHFDDKVGQKYLFESLKAPLVNSYTFYDKKTALKWINNTVFPKVFKLRGGVGSANVKLAKNRKQAKTLVRKAFGKGFSQNDAMSGLIERWRKFCLGKNNFLDIIKGLIRFIYPTKYARVAGKERGYVYFQDFIANNEFDIRVIVINDKAFAIKRMVRENDFRASGSGIIKYEKNNFDEKTIQLAFDITKEMKGQSVALDFVYDNNIPKVVEVSYGFVQMGYDPCPGYWDIEMNWHEGKFDPCKWMVDSVLKQIEEKKKENASI